MRQPTPSPPRQGGHFESAAAAPAGRAPVLGRLVSLLPTFALLTVTALLGAAVVGASQRGAPDRPGLGGLSEDRILLQWRVEEIPLGARWSGLMAATLEPGPVWTQEQRGLEDVGPLLFRVESGALTVRAAGPVNIVVGGASQPHTAPADTDVVLRAGDSGFTAGGTISTWRNDGADPVRIMMVKLAVVGYDTHTILPNGVTRTPLIEQRTAAEPVGPVVVTLRQVTLHSRAALPFDAMPGLALLHIASGELTVLDPPHAGDASNPLASSMALVGRRLSKGTAAMGTFRPGRVATNPATEATTLLLVTMTAVEP